MKIAIIGGGAAGCFCAIGLKRRLPDAGVSVFEAGPKPLAKLAVTGGGRCNLTNSFRDVDRLGEVYPRGEQLMKRALQVLSPADTQRWFEAEGVRLTTQEDQCVFPVSQDAMQVVRTLERRMREAGVALRCNTPVAHIEALPPVLQAWRVQQVSQAPPVWRVWRAPPPPAWQALQAPPVWRVSPGPTA